MAGLMFNTVIEMRQQIPELTGDEFLLFCLICYRTSITTLKADGGKGRKVIHLAGQNDPRVLWGWSNEKFNRAKRRLKELRLISVNRQGCGKTAEVYVTFSEYQKNRSVKSDTSRSVKNDTSDMSKVTHHECQKRHISSVKSDTSLPIEREYIKRIDKGEYIKGGDDERSSSSPSAPASLHSQKRHSKKTEVKAQSPQEAAVLGMLNFLTDSYNQRIDDPAGTMNAWMKFFGKYPADVLMEAAQEVASRNKFFPKPAELIPIVKRINDFRN